MITVIIPVWNLQKRGLDRVFWSLYSLMVQTIPVKAIIYDASTIKSSDNFTDQRVKHIRRKHNKLHIAFMMNRGIELADTPYIATTGADFLFKPNFFKVALEAIQGGGAAFCEVDEMVRGMRLSTQFIDKWEFSKIPQMYRRNRFGRTAPGAINLMRREDWVKSGGYNEDFTAWGGYDNEFYDHIKKTVKPVWIEDKTQVIHQWHKQEKMPKGRDQKTWEANQKRLHELRKAGRPKDANWLNIPELEVAT